MTCGPGKLPKGAVGPNQLRRASRDTLFQIEVELADLIFDHSSFRDVTNDDNHKHTVIGSEGTGCDFSRKLAKSSGEGTHFDPGGLAGASPFRNQFPQV